MKGENKNKNRNKRKVKILVDVLVFLNFAFVYISLALPNKLIHEISGLITIPLVTTHLILNRNWIKAVTKNLLKGKIKRKVMLQYIASISLCIVFIAALVTGLLIASFVMRGNMSFIAHRRHAVPAIIFSVFLGLHIVIHLPFKKLLSAKKAKKEKASSNQDEAVNNQ